MPEQTQQFTQLLHQWSGGNKEALDQLMPVIYDELRRLAGRYLRSERRDHTMRATALVNEAYVRLVHSPEITWESRTHFFGVAARLMREILVDHARAHLARKRGGDMPKLSLDELKVYSPEKSADLVTLDEALDRLAQKDARLSKVVELKFFGGLTFEEIGKMLNIASKTARRDWLLARAWLHAEISK